MSREALQEQHIQHIIETSTACELLSRRLDQLPQLPQVLQQWTGGSPRLLVYTLRALHHVLQDQQGEDAKQSDVDKTMEEVYGILSKEVRQVRSEVFLAREHEAEFRQTWLYLILLAQLRVPCNREIRLPVGCHEQSLEMLLGRLNVYITKPGQPIQGMPDAFYICHMKMIEKFARERYSSDYRVPLFFGGEAYGIRAEDLLEKMVEQRLIVQTCMSQRLPGQSATAPRNASRESSGDPGPGMSPRDPSKDHERHHMLREYQSSTPQNVAPQQSYSCYAKRKQQQIVQTSAQIAQCRPVSQAAVLRDRAARQERDVSRSLLL